MEENRTPVYDGSDNPTACCPRFKPDGWDGQDLHFKEKLFVKARTRNRTGMSQNQTPRGGAKRANNSTEGGTSNAPYRKCATRS